MNNETLDTVLEVFFDEYPGKSTDEERARKHRTWMTILEDITDEQGKIGLRKALNSNREFMPSVGVFRGYCLSDTGCQGLEETASIAWGLVIRHLNIWSSPIFSDSVISATILAIGGWKKLCGMLEKEEPFKRKDFMAAYTDIKRNGKNIPRVKLVGSYNDTVFIGFGADVDTREVLLQVVGGRAKEQGLLSKCMRTLAGRNTKQLEA